MAKTSKKKSGSDGRNPERKNGKAWKQDKYKTPKAKTEARQIKDQIVKIQRTQRKEANAAARQAAIEAAENLKLEEAARAERKAKAKSAKDALNKALRNATVLEVNFDDLGEIDSVTREYADSDIAVASAALEQLF